MRTALLLGALLLLPASGAVVAPDVATFVVGRGPLTEGLLLGLLPERPSEVGIATYAPEPVVRTVRWEEAMAFLADTAFGQAFQTQNHARPAAFLTGHDRGFGIPGSGFFCDNSSGWVGYSKGVAWEGMSYTRAIDLGPVNAVICGGFFGEARRWDVQMSVLPVLLAQLPSVPPQGVWDGCFSIVWTEHPSGYCPEPGPTQPDTFTNWEAQGPGVRTSLDFGTMWFDYFLGDGAETKYGNGLTH